MKNSAGQLAFQPRYEPETSLIQAYNITAIPASSIMNSNQKYNNQICNLPNSGSVHSCHC